MSDQQISPPIKFKYDDLRGDSSDDPADPVAVAIRDGMVWVTLRDGRVIGNPIEWYPDLKDAPLEKLAQVELQWAALGWRALDVDLEVKWMLLGKSEDFD